MNKSYTGPIFFIIHSPEEKPGTQKSAEHESKIAQVLNLAGKRGVPVLYVLPESEKQFQELIKKLKHKPRIIPVDYNLLNAKSIRQALSTAKVIPTKATILGHYREECIAEGAEIIRVLFSHIEIHMLGGKYSLMFTKGSRAMHQSIRDHYKALRAKPSNRLKSTHFAK